MIFLHGCYWSLDGRLAFTEYTNPYGRNVYWLASTRFTGVMQTRREFLKSSAAAAGAGILVPRFARRTNLAIGFQTWVVREQLAEDFTGTLAKMAGMGYESLELCSPVGYQKYGFGHLAGYSAQELKTIIADAGLSCTSSHYTVAEVREDLPARMAFAKEMGYDQMVLAHPGLGADATLGDYKRVCEEINGWGKVTAGEGIQFVYHNHNFEFEQLEGELIYEVLLAHLDPEVVKMQFQVWVVIAGYKAADYFRAHPGRFVSAHLSDWSGKDEQQVPVGTGVVDWPDFFEAGKKGGLKNVYVEMGPDTLPNSAAYLRDLRAG